jgi:hypothetical protein
MQQRVRGRFLGPGWLHAGVPAQRHGSIRRGLHTHCCPPRFPARRTHLSATAPAACLAMARGALASALACVVVVMMAVMPSVAAKEILVGSKQLGWTNRAHPLPHTQQHTHARVCTHGTRTRARTHARCKRTLTHPAFSAYRVSLLRFPRVPYCALIQKRRITRPSAPTRATPSPSPSPRAPTRSCLCQTRPPGRPARARPSASSRQRRTPPSVLSYQALPAKRTTSRAPWRTTARRG